eukprot:1866270-Pyramimonas_sp.AAC.1
MAPKKAVLRLLPTLLVLAGLAALVVLTLRSMRNLRNAASGHDAIAFHSLAPGTISESSSGASPRSQPLKFSHEYIGVISPVGEGMKSALTDVGSLSCLFRICGRSRTGSEWSSQLAECPGRVHFFFVSKCDAPSDWQAEGIMFSIFEAGIKGTVTRLVSCENAVYEYPIVWNPCYNIHIIPHDTVCTPP